MSTYQFSFVVDGDFDDEYWEETNTVVSDSLEGAVEESYPCYVRSMGRITRFPMESVVEFTPKMSKYFSISGTCDGDPMAERILREAFYAHRIREFQFRKPHWTPYT